jgi:hypothetical protein
MPVIIKLVLDCFMNKIMAEFDFTIQYRPGIKDNLADECSRVPSEGSDKLP